VIVPDVETCDFIVGTTAAQDHRNNGIRAAQSTPLISRTGTVLGMISTHWRQPHDPAANELRLMDILARQAADLIDRKRGVEQLRRNADTFFNLVQNSPFGVYIVDAQFRLRQISAGSRKVFSNIDPLIGRDFAEVLHIIWPEAFANEVIAHFRHTLASGEPYHAPNTTQQRHNIDDVESYDWKIERITLPDGQYGVVCHFYDATRLRQAEERLTKAKQEAEAANRAKDRFLAVLSHELRTPLTPVMLTIAAREMDPDLPLPVRDDLKMIRRNVELEVRLIDDLLDLSRITSGKLQLQFDVLDFNDLVGHVCEMCRSNAVEKRVDLHCEIDPRVNDVVGDQGRVQND
jgi:signal transduction histidine kinase